MHTDVHIHTSHVRILAHLIIIRMEWKHSNDSLFTHLNLYNIKWIIANNLDISFDDAQKYAHARARALKFGTRVNFLPKKKGKSQIYTKRISFGHHLCQQLCHCGSIGADNKNFATIITNKLMNTVSNGFAGFVDNFAAPRSVLQ